MTAPGNLVTSKRPRRVSPPTIQNPQFDKGAESDNTLGSKLSNLPATVIYEIADHLIAAALKTKLHEEGSLRDAFPTHNSTSHILWPLTTCSDLIALSSTCRYLRVALRGRALVRAVISARCRSLLAPQAAFHSSELHQLQYIPGSGIEGVHAHLRANSVLALCVDAASVCFDCTRPFQPLRNSWIPIFTVLPALQYLRVSDRHPGGTIDTVSASFFQEITYLLPQLKVLELVNFSFGHQPGFSLSLSNLERLSLGCCYGSWAVDSSVHLPKLKSLNLGDCPDMYKRIPVGILRGLSTFNLRLDMERRSSELKSALLGGFGDGTTLGPSLLEELFLDLMIDLAEVAQACASPHLKTLGICVSRTNLTPESLESWAAAWYNLTDLRICPRRWDIFKTWPLFRSYNSWHQAFSGLPNLRILIYSLENQSEYGEGPDLCTQLEYTWCWEMAAISACPELERLERRGTEALVELAKSTTPFVDTEGLEDSDSDVDFGEEYGYDPFLSSDYDEGYSGQGNGNDE